MADNNNILDEEAYDPDIITLKDENDEEYQFEVVDATDYNGAYYLAVVPYAENPEDILEEDAELLFFRTIEDNGEELLEAVDDADEIIDVGRMFADRLKDVYDIDPEEFM